MPADQAEIHGIERQPTVQSHVHTNEHSHPPNEDPNVDIQPPVSNDQPPLNISPNEQGQPPIRTSPAKQGHPPLTDSIDNIDEDMEPIDNMVDSNKNVTNTSVYT